MSPELIGILAVGVALAGLVLTAGCMTAATLRRLRSDMGQLRGEMEQLRNEVRALAARVGTLELRVGALEQRMARLEGLLEGAGLYQPAVVSGAAAD